MAIQDPMGTMFGRSGNRGGIEEFMRTRVHVCIIKINHEAKLREKSEAFFRFLLQQDIKWSYLEDAEKPMEYVSPQRPGVRAGQQWPNALWRLAFTEDFWRKVNPDNLIAGAIAVSHLRAIEQCMRRAGPNAICVVLEEDVVATGQAQTGFIGACMGIRDLLRRGEDKVLVFGTHSHINRDHMKIVLQARRAAAAGGDRGAVPARRPERMLRRR